jgi:hypothetical protein
LFTGFIAYANWAGKHEIGWACNTYGGEEESIQGLGGGEHKQRNLFEDPGIDGRIILK